MRIHKNSIQGLLGAAVFGLGQLAAVAQALTMVNEPIPSQPIAEALSAFSRQTGLQVVYMSKIADGLVSAPAPAGVSAQQALQKILNASGLEFEFLNERTVTVFAADTSERTSVLPSQRGWERESPPQGDGAVDNDARKAAHHLAQASGRNLYAEADGASAKEESETIKLEEILVTARRKEERAQSVPIAITAVSQQTLQDNNVFTISELQYLVPSMSATSAFFNRDSVNVSIRGQGSNRYGGRPGVVTYLNEVPVPTVGTDLAGGPGLMFDLDHVAVLKGPQGTLFGRNSVGGALLLQTARPKNEFAGRLQLGAGNYDNREIDGMINFPLVSDTLLARIAFNGGKRDGFTTLQGTRSNPDRSIDVDDREFWSVRGSVTFRPDERFENDAIVTYQDYDSNGSPLLITAVNDDPAGCGGFGCVFPAYVPGYLTLAQQQIALGIRTAIAQSVDPESSGSNLSVNNVTRIQLTDNLTLRNILGYDEAKTVMAFDFDATVLPLFDGIALPSSDTLRQFTEEVQLLGKAFDGRVDWQLGAFYLRAYNPGYDRETATNGGVTTDSETRTVSKSKAGFAQGAYHLSSVDGLSINAGLRYTADSGQSRSRGGPLQNYCCESSSSEESTAWTWTLGLEYQASPDTLLYLASRRGYRPGGSNGVDAVTLLPRPDYDPEYVADLELGLKSDWSLGSVPVRTNVAFYYQDYSDAQFTLLYLASPDPFDTITGNAAAATQWGAELEAEMQLTDDLQLGLNFNYLSFDYRGIAEGVNTADLELTSKTNRPPYKYGVNVRYHLPVAERAGDVSVYANWVWQDDSGDPALQFGGFIPSFGLLNMSVNWDGAFGKPIDVSLYGSNLLDEEYRTGGDGFFNTLGFDLYRFGEPRMYGLRVRYRFGAP